MDSKTDNQVKDLIKEYRAGNQRIISEIYNICKPHIQSIGFSLIRKYKISYLDFDDIMISGDIAFMECIEKFDFKYSTKFSTLLYVYFKNSLYKMIEDHSRKICHYRFTESEDEVDVYKFMISYSSLKDHRCRTYDMMTEKMIIDDILEELKLKDPVLYEIYNYYYIDRLSCREISEHIDRTKQRVQQLVQKIQQHFLQKFRELNLTRDDFREMMK